MDKTRRNERQNSLADPRYVRSIEKHKRYTALKLLRFERSLLFFWIKQTTATCQSPGKTEKRNGGVKKDAIAAAITINIGAMINFEKPLGPSAQFKTLKPDRTSGREKLKSCGSGGSVPRLRGNRILCAVPCGWRRGRVRWYVRRRRCSLVPQHIV